MVDRYSLEAFGDRDDMWPRNDGQRVRYFDYAALSAKLAEAEAALRTAGVCMSCVYGVPEAYGCSDCLNTGWDGGAPTGYVHEARVAELEKALKPFADAIFNDNGDIAVNMSFVDADDYIRAYFVLRKSHSALSATKEPKPDTPHRAGGQAMTDAPREIIEEARRIAADIASSSNYSVGVIADALIARDKRAAEKCDELAKAAQALIDRPAMFGWQYDAKVWVITEKRAYEKASTAILTYDTPTGREPKGR